jgi:cytochrome c-type biogenesis protein CcmF
LTTLGQLCLLTALVASGYGAFACFLAWRRQHELLDRIGHFSVVVGMLALTSVGAILAVALLLRDFQFAYVAQYTSRTLPWHYALSAFWVGQAGSLLLWAWSVGVLAVVFRFRSGHEPRPLRQLAFAILAAYQFFLVAIMVFGANPMQASLTVPRDGAGLGPLLQHPAMLLHPPIVFLGYAGCAVPFALAIAAILSGRLDAAWVREARPWAFFTWAILGIGILVGAYWAYEELGWGGYWNWDPVENGSLLPWLTATAMIHAAMVYRQHGGLKRTTLLLAIATFAACNFAAFLTRSGVFSSLHSFSQSPIGWMFLLLFVVLAAGTGLFMVRRHGALTPDGSISGLWAKEGVIAASVLALVLLAAAVFIGTASMPLSDLFFAHKVLVGPGFYNGALIPVSLSLLVAMAAAPLLQWGAPPGRKQRMVLLFSALAGLVAAALVWLSGFHQYLIVTVAALTAATATAVIAAWVLDVGRDVTKGSFLWRRLPPVLSSRRRTYAGYTMHLAIACLAVGVAGSSLGAWQRDFTLAKGESIHWAGRDVRFVRILQQQLPEKVVMQAELEITPDGGTPYTLRPAQEYYPIQNQWSPQVAIHSTWGGDFYTILHSGEGEDRIRLTIVENPLMRWMWLAGWLVPVGAVPWFWPSRRAAAAQADGRKTRNVVPKSRRRKAA